MLWVRHTNDWKSIHVFYCYLLLCTVLLYFILLIVIFWIQDFMPFMSLVAAVERYIQQLLHSYILQINGKRYNTTSRMTVFGFSRWNENQNFCFRSSLIKMILASELQQQLIHRRCAPDTQRAELWHSLWELPSSRRKHGNHLNHLHRFNLEKNLYQSHCERGQHASTSTSWYHN